MSQLCQILRGPSTSECDGSGAGGQAGGVQVVRQPLSEEQRLQKVIVELIETEQLYVKVHANIHLYGVTTDVII